MRFYYPLFAGLMVMVGALLLFTQLVNVHQAIASSHWKPVSAEIIDTKLAIKMGARFDPVSDGLRAIMLPSMFALPRVGFVYTIDGSTWSSVNYSYSLDPFGPKQKQVTEEYPLGSVAEAYVNPDALRDAVLKPGLSQHFYLTVISAGALIGLGLCWLFARNADNVV